KRLVAYTSVSHLGFVLLGIFSRNPLGLQGAVMTMISHGLSTGALFVLAGSLQERLHTRDLDQMGGLWSTMPRLSGAALFFSLGSLGLPDLGNFGACNDGYCLEAESRSRIRANPRRTGRGFPLDFCGSTARSPASHIPLARGPVRIVLHGPDHCLSLGSGSVVIRLLQESR